MSSVKEDLPAPGAELFPARPTRERIDDLLTRELADANERVARGSVMPTLETWRNSGRSWPASTSKLRGMPSRCSPGVLRSWSMVPFT